MCECKTVSGGVIICDNCASAMIEALNGLLPGEQEFAQQLPGVMTQGEYNGMLSAVNGWMSGLQGNKVADEEVAHE